MTKKGRLAPTENDHAIADTADKEDWKQNKAKCFLRGMRNVRLNYHELNI